MKTPYSTRRCTPDPSPWLSSAEDTRHFEEAELELQHKLLAQQATAARLDEELGTQRYDKR